jgi:serine/threonine-protein kinase
VSAPESTAIGGSEVSPSVAGGPAASSDRSERVKVSIQTDPAGARITLDGQNLGQTPAEIEVDRSTRPLHLVVGRAGYHAWVEDIVPSSDVRLQLVLRAVSAGTPGTASPRPSASRGFRRFD